MASPTLRENRATSTAHNVRFTDSGTIDGPDVPAAQQHYDEARWTAVQPVSGTPLWARPGPNGGRAAVPPWEPWPQTPQDHSRFAAKLAAVREGPEPAAMLATPKPAPSYAWRVAFDGSDVGDPTPAAPIGKTATVVAVAMPNPVVALRKRIALLLGFAYLLLYALASGLAVPLIAEGESKGEEEDEPSERPSPASAPPQVNYRPRPRPLPDPHAPGLHIRPDGSRYLVVPLGFAGAVA